MRKITRMLLCAILACLLVFSMTACHNETDNPTSGNKTESQVQSGSNSEPTTATQNGDKTEAPTDEPTEAVTPDNWGVTGDWSASNGGKTTMFYINFPAIIGVKQGTGMLAAHSDGSVIIVSGQHMDDMDVESFGTFFPDYFEDLKVTLQDYYGFRASDYALDVQESKAMTVGSYEMHKFTGNLSMAYKGEPRAYVYVAYATSLEFNDAYVYWFLYGTEDQIDMLEEYAYNMALTLRRDAGWWDL